MGTSKGEMVKMFGTSNNLDLTHFFSYANLLPFYSMQMCDC